MLTALALLFVGAVLCLNGLWMQNRISDREIIIINLVVAAITATVALLGAAGATDMAGVKSAALTLLFSTTYLWFGYNRITGVDGRGLGWFSLFVAITVVPVFLQDTWRAQGWLELWLAVSWGVWAVLWFLFFLLLTLKLPISRSTAFVTLFSGVATGWMPAMVMLLG
ncbi:AmiS/UreI family transporter [Pararhodobacter sp.]|uniref:AmiS/UreI family transporter n=1 Tax=Pararhodobacter sp. TaxID=2127056 RepID=UPI002AFF7791|nr:AmiS/UreI family transporter [Pararhodobacter sp.]